MTQCFRIERSDLSTSGKSKGGFGEIEKSKGKNRKVPWAPKVPWGKIERRRRRPAAVSQAPKAPRQGAAGAQRDVGGAEGAPKRLDVDGGAPQEPQSIVIRSYF